MTQTALEALQAALAEAGTDRERAKAIFEKHITPELIAEILGKDRNQAIVKSLFARILADRPGLENDITALAAESARRIIEKRRGAEHFAQSIKGKDNP